MSHPLPLPARPGTLARRLRTALLALAALLVALAVLLLGSLWYIKHMDWNAYKADISDQVMQLTGRPLRIAGNLTADWHWPNTSVAGWRSWVPSVTVTALDVVVGNPAQWPVDAFSDPGDFLEAQRVQAHVQLLPLLSRTLQVDLLQLAGAYGRLQQWGDTADGAQPLPAPAASPGSDPDAALQAPALVAAARAQVADSGMAAVTEPLPPDNWHLRTRGPAPADRPWRMQVRELQLDDSTISYENLPAQLFLRARFSPAEQAPYRLAFALVGHKGQAQLQGEGMVGDVLHLQGNGQSLPLQLHATSGRTKLSLEGTLRHPQHLDGVDFQLQLSGGNMQDLYALTGLVLPNTPAFEVKGRLQGRFTPHQAQWALQSFSGQVGSSDLQGDLRYTSGTERPLLESKLRSKQLHLADLGALIGAGPRADDGKAAGKGGKPDSVLPRMELAVERWKHMDAQVSLAADKIIRPEALPLEKLDMTVKLDNGVMRIDPLNFGLAEGTLAMPVVVDGQRKPVRTEVHAKVRGLKLAALFPTVERTRKSLGELDGSIQLAGSGDSVAAMLGSANGSVKLYVSSGTVSKQLLDMAALNLGSVVISRFFGADKEVPIRCMAADFQVKGGVAHSTLMRLSAADAYIDGSGDIDLRRELVNLQLKPMSTSWKLFTLRSPLQVSGPLGHPQVQVQSAGVLARAGAALAAVVAAPAALAVLPLTAPPADDPTHCAQLLAAVQQ
ncbi:MAG: AsmA family protein [Comamonas sp.]